MKKNNKINYSIVLSIIFLFLFMQKINAQEKRYSFIVKRNEMKTHTLFDYDKIYEFNSQRNYINDSTFFESGILDENTLFEFKKDKEDNWYLKQNGKWIIFFNHNINYISNITFNDIKYSIHWKKANFWNESKMYIFTLTPLNHISVSNLPDLVFDDKEGIIGVYGDILIIRRDFINYFR